MTDDSGQLLTLFERPLYFGRMTDPTSAAYLKGPCGDELEMYLIIEDRIIKEITFYTEGCIPTRVCGSMVARLARGKSVDAALGISARDVIKQLKDLPPGHAHCSILAVSTLYRAIADYLLKQ